MTFQHSWQKVVSGQKTQTRRLAQDEDKLWNVHLDERDMEEVLWRGDRPKWRTDRSYAVQPGRGKKAIARIILLDIRNGHLGYISGEEARAEGFSSLEEFIAGWKKIDKVYDPEQPAWILEFRVKEKK